MNKIKLISIVFLLISFTSCKNNTLEPLNNSKVSSLSVLNNLQDYYPLNEGYTWSYSLKQFQDEQPNTKFSKMIVKVTDRSKKESYDEAIIERFYPESSIKPNPTLAKVYTESVFLSRYVKEDIFKSFIPNSLNTNLGILNNNTSSGLENSNRGITIIKKPFKVGESWSGRIFKGGKEIISIAGFEKIETSIGIFNTLKINHKIIHDNGREDNLYYWYDKKIGTIKMHEEISVNLGNKWVKLKSIGLLDNFSKN